jgi:hypothetical protein
LQSSRHGESSDFAIGLTVALGRRMHAGHGIPRPQFNPEEARIIEDMKRRIKLYTSLGLVSNGNSI